VKGIHQLPEDGNGFGSRLIHYPQQLHGILHVENKLALVKAVDIGADDAVRFEHLAHAFQPRHRIVQQVEHVIAGDEIELLPQGLQVSDVHHLETRLFDLVELEALPGHFQGFCRDIHPDEGGTRIGRG
jgi:hypothetical protein